MEDNRQVNKYGGNYLSHPTERTICLEGPGLALDGAGKGQEDEEGEGEVVEGDGEVGPAGLVAPHSVEAGSSQGLLE